MKRENKYPNLIPNNERSPEELREMGKKRRYKERREQTKKKRARENCKDYSKNYDGEERDKRNVEAFSRTYSK